MRHVYLTALSARDVQFTYTLDDRGEPADIEVVAASGSTATDLIEQLGAADYEAMRELAELRVARSFA